MADRLEGTSSHTETVQTDKAKAPESKETPKAESVQSSGVEGSCDGRGVADGAMFFCEISKEAIFQLECTNPFKRVKIFNLSKVDKEPLTLEQVPPQYRPYPGCLFDVLSEPDNDKRFQDLCSFFHSFGSPGDKGRECGLTYSIMQLFAMIHSFLKDLNRSGMPYPAALLEYFIDAGMIECLVRLLICTLQPKLLQVEYNRYAPFRLWECLYACTHPEQPQSHAMVHRIIENEQRAADLFLPYLNGRLTHLETMIAAQVVGNLAQFKSSMNWLLDHPSVCAAAGRQLWLTFNTQYSSFRQHQDLQLVYHRVLYDHYFVYKDWDNSFFRSDIFRLPYLTVQLTLRLLCNICGAHPDDKALYEIEPSILAIVEEGLYEHIGDIISGILLCFNDNQAISPDKLTLFVSWSLLQNKCKKKAMEQLDHLPYTRRDKPLYFSRQSYSKSRSVMAFLITHALWFDDSFGSRFAAFGILGLLRDDEVAMELIRIAGDLLFDLAHSLRLVRLPGEKHPIPIKTAIFEVFLRLGGHSYFKADKSKAPPGLCKFKEPVPQCIIDAKEFCERHLKERLLAISEKQRLVRCADSFKTEGNEFFQKELYHDAIVCYTKALEICPLTCTERRVTYYSNRAECYIQSNQPRKAISDCSRALAQNASAFKARWRRAQALSQIGARHLAGLDFFTIAHRDDKSAHSLFGPERWGDIKKEYERLLQDMFTDIAEQQLGPTVYRGRVGRDFGLRVDERTPASGIPPHLGESLFQVQEGDHLYHGF